VYVKFHLNRCRFAVAVAKCLGDCGSLFGTVYPPNCLETLQIQKGRRPNSTFRAKVSICWYIVRIAGALTTWSKSSTVARTYHPWIWSTMAYLEMWKGGGSGVAGQGGPGVRTPPPELSSGVHVKHKNPMRFFSCRGVVTGARQPMMTKLPWPLLNLQTRLRRWGEGNRVHFQKCSNFSRSC